MTIGKAALDLWTAGVVVALCCIALFFVAGAVVSLLTVAGARRRSQRPRHDLGQLTRCYPSGQLAEVDDALDRIMAEERGGRASFPW